MVNINKVKMDLNYENLDDKDLITLLDTSLCKMFHLIGIEDLFNYYIEHNYTLHDILMSIVELKFGPRKRCHYVDICGKYGDYNIEKLAKTSISNLILLLDDYIHFEDHVKMNVNNIDLEKLYQYIVTINRNYFYFTNSHLLDIIDIIKEIIELDKNNGNKIINYIDEVTLNNENYHSLYSHNAHDTLLIFLLFQHLTGVRYKEDKENGIYKSKELDYMRTLPPILVSILSDLADKKKNGEEFKDNFERVLYSKLVTIHYNHILVWNLDNLRYLKANYKSFDTRYLNKLMIMNDIVLNDMTEIIDPVELKRIKNYKTKFNRYVMERSLEE